MQKQETGLTKVLPLLEQSLKYIIEALTLFLSVSGAKSLIQEASMAYGTNIKLNQIWITKEKS